MDKSKKYHGIIPAFYACYDEAGEVSEERTGAFAAHLVRKGVNGLYVGGSSGECIYQSVEERKRVLACVMQEAGGKTTVIAHVGCNNTRDSQELAAYARSLGVDGIASIPPVYFKLPEYGVAEYWNAISAAAPGTDFFIYNIPQLAGTALTQSLLETMLQNPAVKGVKNSSISVLDIRMQKMTGGEGFTVFSGVDEQFLAGRAMGADGGIGGTYAVMPELFLAMDRLVEEGNYAQARSIQMDVDLIIDTMCGCHGNLYAVMKEILKKREHIDIGGVRAPLTPISAQDMERVDESIRFIGEAVKKYQY